MACLALPIVTRPSGSLNNCCKSHWFRPPWHPGWPTKKKNNWVQYTSEPLGRHSGCNKFKCAIRFLLTLTKALFTKPNLSSPVPLLSHCSQHHTSNRIQSHSEAGGPACIRSPLPANKHERTTGSSSSSSSRSSSNNNNNNNSSDNGKRNDCTPAPWCTPPQ